jgi:hypothetical protein
MNMQYSISILAQAGEEEPITEGMTGQGSQVVAIDNQFSLFGLAEDKADQAGKTSRLSLEILLDDIQTNLSSREYAQASNDAKHVMATHCIQESFENINDYLISQGSSIVPAEHEGVALSVMQVIHGECSFIHADEHCCLHFREGKLMNLTQAKSTEDSPKTLLGITGTVNIKLNQLSITPGDLLLTCNHELLQHVTPEYLRVTMMRFQDSPQMAMRQITSKAQRSGMQGKPVLVIVTINQITDKPRSWFKK